MSAQVFSVKSPIVWRNVILMTLVHIGALYGLFLMLFRAKFATFLWTYGYGYCGALGVTAGAHRLYSHRSYKARWPLRLLLVILQTIAMQDSIIHWCRDHRMHHMYSETDADPHNAKRGFFFSHVGWLLVKKHPELRAKAHTVDVSDLWADPLVRLQKKYYLFWAIPFCILIPTYVPTLWGDTLWNGFFICTVYRIVLSLNTTWLVNSAAHMWGNRPYDKSINPAENKLVAFLVFGEGFHNYHHTFPWDYKTDEYGNYSLNLTALFIDIMAKIGLAYDLKTASAEVIQARKLRTGDGSHKESQSTNCK